jgi:hypothetical protein
MDTLITVCAIAHVSADARCESPQDINHNYDKPGYQHWTVPCMRGGEPDTPCNIYMDDRKCQDKTVCTLEPT